MKVIELTKGYVTIVDDEMFDQLAQYRWHLSSGYARRQYRGVKIYMHRVIYGELKCLGKDIDHKNGDRLDNRRCNLRVCSESQNLQNKKISSNNKVGFKGVSWDKLNSKFVARIQVPNGRYLNLGRFKKIEDASIAYQIAATKHFGEFARFQ